MKLINFFDIDMNTNIILILNKNIHILTQDFNLMNILFSYLNIYFMTNFSDFSYI